jgi:hypothetical protein
MTLWPGGPQCSGLDMTTLALGSMEACHSYLTTLSLVMLLALVGTAAACGAVRDQPTARKVPALLLVDV